jgi:uncharacterized protein (DUF2384 family)
VSSYTEFSDLPDDIQGYIRKLDQPDSEAWVGRPIPALGDRSVLDAINDSGGEALVRDFLIRALGKFG